MSSSFTLSKVERINTQIKQRVVDANRAYESLMRKLLQLNNKAKQEKKSQIPMIMSSKNNSPINYVSDVDNDNS